MALVVVCVTLVMLPSLNRQLTTLIKSHLYLVVYDSMSKPQQSDIIQNTKVLTPLTDRETKYCNLF